MNNSRCATIVIHRDPLHYAGADLKAWPGTCELHGGARAAHALSRRRLKPAVTGIKGPGPPRHLGSAYRRCSNRHRIWVPTRKSALLGESASLPRRLRVRNLRVSASLRRNEVACQVADGRRPRTEDGKAFFTTKVTKRTKGLCPRMHADDVIAIAGFLCALGDLCGESFLCASASLREKCFLRDLRVLRGEKIHSLKPAVTLVNCYAFNVFKNLCVSATL